MTNHSHIQQTIYVEQLVVSVIDGLEKLADILPYEFDETIDTIEGLYAIKFQKPEAQEITKEDVLAGMQEYIEKSGKGEARRIVEVNREAQHDE